MKDKIIEKNRRIAEWALSLKGLPGDVWFRPFKEGSWGTAEVIAHLMFWDHNVIDSRLKPFLQNEKLSESKLDVQKINDNAAAYARKTDKQEVIDEFVNARIELIGLIEAMPSEAFSQKLPGEKMSWSHYFQELIQHDKHYQNQINALLTSVLPVTGKLLLTSDTADLIEGSDIFLKEFINKDAAELLHLQVENKEFFEQFSMRQPNGFYTEQGQEERIRSFRRDKEKDESYNFGIYSSSESQLLGTINLFQILRGSLQSAFIGYFMDRKQNGKGYTSEAVKLLVHYGFKELKLHRIEAGVMPYNTASIRVLEKAGFYKEGIARKSVNINGKWEDHQVLAIINPAHE